MKKVTEIQLKNGLQLFWAQGFDKVSDKDILKAMDLTEPEFEKDFGTKAKLYCELLDFYDKHYWTHAKEKFAKSDDLMTGLKTFYDDEVRILKEKEAPCGFIIGREVDGLVPEVEEVEKTRQQLIDSYFNLFLEKLDQAVKAKKLGDMTDCGSLARDLWTQFLEIAHEASKADSTRNLHTLVKAALEEVPVLP